MTVPSAIRTTRELFLQNQVNYQCFSEYHYNNGAERVGELWRMQLGWQNHLFLPSIALALAMSHGKVDHRALECKREFFFSLLSELCFFSSTCPETASFLEPSNPRKWIKGSPGGDGRREERGWTSWGWKETDVSWGIASWLNAGVREL